MTRSAAHTGQSSSMTPTAWWVGIRGGVLALVCLLWLGPYAWMTLTSFKTLPEIIRAPAAPLPRGFDLDAYERVFESLPVGRYFLNTLLMALLIAALQILIALPAAYALAKLRFRGRALAFALVVAFGKVPVIPEFR